MSLRNTFDRLAPNLANAGSAAKRKLKSFHPVKQLVTWIRQGLRQVSKAKISIKMKADSLGAHRPSIPLSFRTAAESDAINIVVGNAFDASSEEGIVLKDKDNPDDWTNIDGIETEKRKVDDNETSKDEVIVRKVKKTALQARKTKMDDATQVYVNANARYIKAVYQDKSPEEINTLFADMEKNSKEQTKAQNEYQSLRRIANRLKLKELGEKHGSAYAVKVLTGVKVMAGAIDPSAFDEAIAGVKRSMGDAWKRQAALDVEVQGLAEDLKAWVYEDVVDFLDSDTSRFQILVQAKSKHQITSGTRKLAFATPGLEDRLPGLDYYVLAARDKYPELKKPATRIKTALEMMKADWELFKPAMSEQLANIRYTNPENSAEGSFDSSRMSDYYNINAYNHTLSDINVMLADEGEQGIADLLATFGENIGFGLGKSEDSGVQYRSKMAEKYGVSEGQFQTVEERLKEKGVSVEALHNPPATDSRPEGSTVPETEQAGHIDPQNDVQIPEGEEVNARNLQQKPSREKTLIDFDSDTSTPLASGDGIQPANADNGQNTSSSSIQGEKEISQPVDDKSFFDVLDQTPRKDAE